MDEFLVNADMLYEQYVILEGTIMELQKTLREIFEDVEHPKRPAAAKQIKEIIEQWQQLMQMQRGFLNRMEQDTLSNSIEVTGLPEEYGKDIEGVAGILAHILHISIEESYITGFERLGDLIEDGRPRPLIVHLINDNIKRRILTVAESVVVSILGSDIPMEIVEHLTTYNKQLLNKTRQEALKHNVNNVWVKDGKIFFKKGEDSFTFEVQSEADLKHMSQF